MGRKSLGLAFGIGLLSLSSATVCAQGQPEVVVRQGDSIEWSGAGAPPHKLRFGGPGGTTSIAVIKTILEGFNPPIPDNATVWDSPQGGGKFATLKVKDDAPPGATFVFICGIHLGQMLSLPFKVEAKVAGEGPRTHKVIGVPGPDWHLHVDTTPPQ
jgi:hypothetical protein